MTSHDALRALVEAAPADSLVSVPRGWLVALLEAEPAPDQPAADLTAAELAARWKRGASTVRMLCEAGTLEGAYKFNGREWRIPWATVERYEQAQRSGEAVGPKGSADPWGLRAIVDPKPAA